MLPLAMTSPRYTHAGALDQSDLYLGANIVVVVNDNYKAFCQVVSEPYRAGPEGYQAWYVDLKLPSGKMRRVPLVWLGVMANSYGEWNKRVFVVKPSHRQRVFVRAGWSDKKDFGAELAVLVDNLHAATGGEFELSVPHMVRGGVPAQRIVSRREETVVVIHMLHD